MSDETKGHCCGGCHGAGFVSEGDEDQDCDACDGSGISGTKDWPAFWQSLTAADAAACLRAAPRVAGEWEWFVPGHQRRLRAGRPHDVIASIRRSAHDGWWRVYPALVREHIPGHKCDFYTEQEARSACDAALRAAGWRVL